MNDALADLLSHRFHGAANISGIRYQLKYSLLRSFDVYSGATGVRFEGIEDVDLLGLHVGDEYCQCKTSGTAWHWSKLWEPVASFLKALAADPSGSYTLVTGFSLRKELGQLAQRRHLGERERARIEEKFVNLCSSKGANGADARALLERLTIRHVPEGQLDLELAGKVAQCWEAGPALDLYVTAALARALDWAIGRKTIVRADFDEVLKETRDLISIEQGHQARGRGLVRPVPWEDAVPDDFRLARDTRPGHIAAALDVQRPRWSRLIHLALSRTSVCVLKGPSGQGKSTIAYRYAFEHAARANVLEVREVSSEEQVTQILDYVRSRVRIGQLPLLLIDDASWERRYWHRVATDCAALNVRVLVTSRTEDWQRFAAALTTNHEVLDVTLEEDEAEEIFERLRKGGLVHPSAVSAPWAFEQLGSPALLLEFVFLVTQGTSLRSRLTHQLNRAHGQGEDPGRPELLRRIAMAHLAGVPLDISRLVQDVALRDDPQRVMATLVGEFVQLEGAEVTGLHRVRSEHLVRILHEMFPAFTQTAVACIRCVGSDHLAGLLRGVLMDAGVDTSQVLHALAGRMESLSDVSAIVEAVFEAGEGIAFERNRRQFEEAYGQHGGPGVYFLAATSIPSNAVSPSTMTLMPEAVKWREAMVLEPRGRDLCRSLFAQERVAALQFPRDDARGAADVLEWCAVAGYVPPAWVSAAVRFLDGNWTEVPAGELSRLLWALHALDPAAYRAWSSVRLDELRAWLCAKLDCYDIERHEDVVRIAFFIEGDASPNKQAVSRLEVLRGIFPDCSRYESGGQYMLPFGLQPSHDDSKKAIPRENLPLSWDVARNKIWLRGVTRPFLPDGYYRFQQGWSQLRRSYLRFMRDWVALTDAVLLGRPHPTRDFDYVNAMAASAVTVASCKDFVTLRGDNSSELQEAANGADKWKSTVFSVLNHLHDFAQDRNERAGRLLVLNLGDAKRSLCDVQRAFALLFTKSPDYFEMAGIDREETAIHANALDALEALVQGIAPRAGESVVEAVGRWRSDEARKAMTHLRELASEMFPPGKVVVAESLVCAGETSYAGVAVQLADPYDFAEALRVGVELAKRAPEESDFFFCVLPVHRSAIVLDRSYLFTRWRALELDKGEPTDNWETLATAPIPPAVLPLFPSLRVVPSRKLFLRSAPLVVGMAAAVYGASRALGPLKVMSGKWAAQALAQQSERIERYARSAQELIDGLLKALEEEQLLGTTGVAERLWTLHRALDEPAALEPKLVGPDAAEELLRLVQDL